MRKIKYKKNNKNINFFFLYFLFYLFDELNKVLYLINFTINLHKSNSI